MPWLGCELWVGECTADGSIYPKYLSVLEPATFATVNGNRRTVCSPPAKRRFRGSG